MNKMMKINKNKYGIFSVLFGLFAVYISFYSAYAEKMNDGLIWTPLAFFEVTSLISLKEAPTNHEVSPIHNKNEYNDETKKIIYFGISSLFSICAVFCAFRAKKLNEHTFYLATGLVLSVCSFLAINVIVSILLSLVIFIWVVINQKGLRSSVVN